MSDIPLGLLLVALTAVPAVALAEKVRLPSILGLLLTGWLLGPSAFGLMADPHDIELLAEIGIALLLFTIGLESHFDLLWSLRRWMLVGGGGLVLGTGVLGTAVVLLVGYEVGPAILVGLALSMSSSVLGLGLLQRSASLDSTHGRGALSVLLLQDVLLVPVLLLLPFLGDGGGGGLSVADIGTIVAKAALVLVLAAAGSRLLLPLLSRIVQESKSTELRILSVIGVVLAAGTVAEAGGVSFALGAFAAGLAMSGTRLVHEYHDTVLPFRDVLTALFFVAVGLSLDLGHALDAPLTLVLLLIVAVPVKIAVGTGIARAMRLPLPEALLFGTVLGQAGELALVVVLEGELEGVFSAGLAGSMLLAIAVSMILGAAAHPIARARLTNHAFSQGREDTVTKSLGPRERVIIVGGGIAGRRIADGLRVQDVPYGIIERSAPTVSSLHEHGFTAVRGDATDRALLEREGLGRAWALVVTVPDLLGTLAIVAAARGLQRDVPLLLRARNHRDTPRLEALDPVAISCDEDEVGASLSFHVAELLSDVDFVEIPGPHLHEASVIERLAIPAERGPHHRASLTIEES